MCNLVEPLQVNSDHSCLCDCNAVARFTSALGLSVLCLGVLHGYSACMAVDFGDRVVRELGRQMALLKYIGC